MTRRPDIILLVALLFRTVTGFLASTQHPPKLSWTLLPTTSIQQFRGLAPVSDEVIWVSGTNGTVLLSKDAGATWSDVSPSFTLPELSTQFEFRDIHAWSARSAVILSIGEGNASRIYRTHDGGMKWEPTFVNREEAAFYDCMAFEREGRGHGVAMSDPVGGKIRLLETWDAGRSWEIVENSGMPEAREGEFGFAASGTCVEVADGRGRRKVNGRWYVATGGIDPGRVWRSETSDVGGKWTAVDTPIAGGSAAGVFSVRFQHKDSRRGVAVGGDFEKPDAGVDNAAWTRDGGLTWEKAESFPGGYRSGAAWVPGRASTAVAVGTSGSDVTVDGGRTWQKIEGDGGFDAVECLGKDRCWASGVRGRVGRLDLRKRQ